MREIAAKNIEWIEFLDTMYNTQIFGKNNKAFYYYPKIDFDIHTHGVQLTFRKQYRKTIILFKDIFGRTVYLTDVDIINIITEADHEIYEIFCEILSEYILHDTKKEISFKINDDDYFYYHIYSDEEKVELLKEHSFMTSADFELKYIDLLTLISLIINKEFLVDSERGTLKSNRQAKKFYILSKFYKEKLYYDELSSINYKVSKKINEVYYNNKIGKEIDVIFDKITI